jgi:hypothetical protein
MQQDSRPEAERTDASHLPRGTGGAVAGVVSGAVAGGVLAGPPGALVGAVAGVVAGGAFGVALESAIDGAEQPSVTREAVDQDATPEVRQAS